MRIDLSDHSSQVKQPEVEYDPFDMLDANKSGNTPGGKMVDSESKLKKKSKKKKIKKVDDDLEEQNIETGHPLANTQSQQNYHDPYRMYSTRSENK